MATSRSNDTDDGSLPTLLGELWQLVVAYAKQETIGPLKNLGRFIAFGLAGSFALGIGTILLGLAALRALQTETGDVFDGNLSFLPYVITLVLTAVLAALSARAITKRKGAS